MLRKTIVIFIIVCLVCSLSLPIHADEEEPALLVDEIEEYSNASTAQVLLSISNNGTTTVKITCLGYSGTTHISSRTYLERWNGSSWSRVSFNGASEITDGVSGSVLIRTYSTTVGSGQYRATSIFTVTLGTDETITVRSTTVTH